MACNFHLTLIRHLPTLANVERQYIGWSDEAIIQPTQNYFTTVGPDIIHGSDLIRCQETAALLYPKTPYSGSSAFREMSFGDWELCTYEELKDEVEYQEWLTNPNESAPPNGEFLDEMGLRVMDGLKKLPLNQSIIVTHGGPIRYMLTQYSPEERDFWSWEVKHGDKWTFSWDHFQSFKEGKRCKSLSVERLTENESI